MLPCPRPACCRAGGRCRGQPDMMGIRSKTPPPSMAAGQPDKVGIRSKTPPPSMGADCVPPLSLPSSALRRTLTAEAIGLTPTPTSWIRSPSTMTPSIFDTAFIGTPTGSVLAGGGRISPTFGNGGTWTPSGQSSIGLNTGFVGTTDLPMSCQPLLTSRSLIRKPSKESVPSVEAKEVLVSEGEALAPAMGTALAPRDSCFAAPSGAQGPATPRTAAQRTVGTSRVAVAAGAAVTGARTRTVEAADVKPGRQAHLAVHWAVGCGA